MKAIIHCGGFGTRLQSITNGKPKPMVEINGKPLLYWILLNLKKNNINEICITLHYMPDEIINYFKDGKELGLTITYFIENKPLGTGGSLKKIKKFIGKENFIIAYGDIFMDFNFRKLITFHKKNNSLITAVIHKSQHPEDSDLVVIQRNKLIKLLKKPHKNIPKNPKNLAALYIMNYKILKYLCKNEYFDIAHDFLPRLITLNKDIFCYNTKELLMDIGTVERFKSAQKVIIK